MSARQGTASSAKRRRGTNVRQRQAQVAVRLSPSELATLKAVAERTGQTLASALRDGFLRHADDMG
jgi:predicted DNA-binding protein